MSARATPVTGEEVAWPLGDYFISRVIDNGTFGTVYHARHVPSDRDVALKLVPLTGVDSDEKVAAERRGALLQHKFGEAHRGLVPEVYEHQRLVPFYAISMELVHGRPLTDLIKSGPLSPERAAAIALAVCRFLEHAHQFETEIEGEPYKVIVHADLKPDHLLLLDNNQICVLDFGIAKALATRTLVTTNKWGSMQYASPERLQSGGHVNEQADFWSLGVILYEMVAGYRPYRQHEHTPGRLEVAIRRHETPEPLPRGTNLVLAAIIRKLLAPQPERRYDSAVAIAADLSAFLRQEPVRAASEQAQASQDTVRIQPRAAGVPRSAEPLPTERLPPAAVAAAQKFDGPASTARARAILRSRPWSLARAARVLLIGAFILLTVSEGIALVRAERVRDQVTALEVARLAAVRSQYRDIGAWAPFGFGRALRLDQALRNRMVELADRTLLEYRTEMPSVAQVQWEQARDCLDLASEIAPHDLGVRSRRSYVEGQLSRIAGRDFPRAIRHFREAARLDPSSPDPYLGLARIYAYHLMDIPSLTQAILDAEARGYRPGRRERAQSGDAYRVRAERSRVAASRLNGEARALRLQEAADDYVQCIERFEGLHYYESERNLRSCRRRLEAINAELNPTPPSPETWF